MNAVKAWMLTGGILAALLAGCNNQNTEEPVAITPAPPPPAPSFPETQVPQPEPQPAPAPAVTAAEPKEPPPPPEPVDESVAAAPKRTAKPAPKPQPKESYARAPKRAAQTYVVRKGDTLQKISQKFYGTTRNWRKVYEANRKTIGPDADSLREGLKLTIP